MTTVTIARRHTNEVAVELGLDRIDFRVPLALRSAHLQLARDYLALGLMVRRLRERFGGGAPRQRQIASAGAGAGGST